MKRFLLFALMCVLLAACGSVSPLGLFATETPTATLTLTPTLTPTLTLTPTVTLTSTPTVSPTPNYPAEGYGPQNFPKGIDPLTGLKVDNPDLLNRRPLAVKVANLPREYRPQWGLSLADHVYEYYTEEGTTRFIALYLGQDASMVGPIRSARFFDNHIMQMYKPDFAFGSADYRVLNLLYNMNYADRLVSFVCPPMCRYEPNGVNYLMTNTANLTKYFDQKKVPGGNGPQNLDGWLFRYGLPQQGAPAQHVYVRYSSAIYNRWDYDPTTGKYYRYSDTTDDPTNGKNEQYAQLTDRLTNQPISADNLLVLYVPHQYYSRKPEIVDIVMAGPGKAYLFRDGQGFELSWQRLAQNMLYNLVTPDNKIFPLKPGNTWIEIVGATTQLQRSDSDWRFTFQIP